MTEMRWHEIWKDQCEAAESIRLRFGIGDAFDYVVDEKLMNFAEATEGHPEFARALPQFVSELRRMFTPEEIEAHLARVRLSGIRWHTAWSRPVTATSRMRSMPAGSSFAFSACRCFRTGRR